LCRGGIFNEAAVIKALQENALPVLLWMFMKLNLRISIPAFQIRYCITTPHLGASTTEAQLNVAVENRSSC